MYIMYTNNVVYRFSTDPMPAPYNVKARGRHGTESLDLTIPAEIKREHGITAGDVFVVEIQDEADDLAISYKRIHEADS